MTGGRNRTKKNCLKLLYYLFTFTRNLRKYYSQVTFLIMMKLNKYCYTKLGRKYYPQFNHRVNELN